MPKFYTVRDMIKAWDEAYGEDLREEEGFLDILEKYHGRDMRSRLRRTRRGDVSPRRTTPPKRKLSAWQKYIKNKRNHIKYRDGKLNLKKMGVAFRRSKRR